MSFGLAPSLLHAKRFVFSQVKVPAREGKSKTTNEKKVGLEKNNRKERCKKEDDERTCISNGEE